MDLIPQGQAWPRAIGSALVNVVTGLTRIWGDFEIRASKLLEMESDPRTTIELLPDWERNWGLPDPCYSAPHSIAERQLALVMRMTLEGGQSRQFFIDVAAMLGYTITITEYRPFFIAMDGCGDCRVYGDLPPDRMRNQWGQKIMDENGDAPVLDGELAEWPNYGLCGEVWVRSYWTVHVHEAKLTWFRVTSGQTGVDPHLRIGLADDLECLLNRWKPAHTQIIFDYSNLETGGRNGRDTLKKGNCDEVPSALRRQRPGRAVCQRQPLDRHDGFHPACRVD
ncbi:YmfQ family protein [Bradyrhizobium sp. S3.7.6]